jgi:death-on-curing protein
MSTERGAEFLYLELEDVLGLYADVFGLDDQGARDRLRNETGLRGALSRPRTYAHYENADISLQAAVLAHGIAEGQHFLEGNKRTALVALRTFLAINGYGVDAPQEDRAKWIISLSDDASIEQLAARIRSALTVLPLASGET